MPSKEEEGLYGEFYMHAVLQPEESKKQGMPVYKDELYIKIQIKGQKNQIRCRKVRDEDRTDYPKAWSIWENKENDISLGTPLSAIPGIGPSMELELKQLGIHTVEDLAGITDATMDKFRGARMLKQRAVAYMEALKVVPSDNEVKGNQENTEDPVDVEVMKRSNKVIPADSRRRANRTIQ